MGLTLRVQVDRGAGRRAVCRSPFRVEAHGAEVRSSCPGGWKRSWAFRRKDRCGMKTEGVRKLWDRYKYAALILLIGAGLLLWPGGSGHTAQTGQSEAPPAYDSGRDAADGDGGNSGADTGRWDRAGAADGGYRWRTAAGPEYGAAIQRQRGGTGGLFQDLGAGACWTAATGKRPVVTRTAVSHLPGGAGGVSGRATGQT